MFRILKRPWQDYADLGIQLIFWLLFIYAGIAIVKKFNLSLISQLFIWPIGSLVWWVLVIQQLEPLNRPKEKRLIPSSSVTIYLKLYGGEHGSDAEREKIRDLTDNLDLLINKNSAGSYDGDEYGNGECVLFMYSDTPENLVNLIKPLLISSDFSKDATIEINEVDVGKTKRMVKL